MGREGEAVRCQTSEAREEERDASACVTGVPFVFHRDVDRFGVADEVEGGQGGVDVHFVGHNINWRLA